jgi:hypothetical protein
MGNNSPDTIAKQKAVMLTAIEANYGNITKAAKMVKITPQTHYRWLKEDSDYENMTENAKDIGFRNVKDSLLELSLKMAEKGNAMVLNQMLRIFFKNTPEEMKVVSRNNNMRVRASVKWVSTPQDPRMPGYVKPTE